VQRSQPRRLDCTTSTLPCVLLATPNRDTLSLCFLLCTVGDSIPRCAVLAYSCACSVRRLLRFTLQQASLNPDSQEWQEVSRSSAAENGRRSHSGVSVLRLFHVAAAEIAIRIQARPSQTSLLHLCFSMTSFVDIGTLQVPRGKWQNTTKKSLVLEVSSSGIPSLEGVRVEATHRRGLSTTSFHLQPC
jgi:hypothetical protein